MLNELKEFFKQINGDSMFKIFLSYLFFVPCFLSAVPDKFPELIDYQKNHVFSKNPYDSWYFGSSAFNCAPELTPFFALVKKEFQVNTVIETGTFIGSSTVLFNLIFDEVHTIEVKEENYLLAQSNLKHCQNVHFYLGSSENILRKILPSFTNKPILFYLDAHWDSYWPLLDELEEISKTHKDNCVIVIDDFKVPGLNFPFDKYEEKECSFEYIQTHLSRVFTDYSFHYLIPCNPKSRAKFVAFPREWLKK